MWPLRPNIAKLKQRRDVPRLLALTDHRKAAVSKSAVQALVEVACGLLSRTDLGSGQKIAEVRTILACGMVDLPRDALHALVSLDTGMAVEEILRMITRQELLDTESEREPVLAWLKKQRLLGPKAGAERIGCYDPEHASIHLVSIRGQTRFRVDTRFTVAAWYIARSDEELRPYADAFDESGRELADVLLHPVPLFPLWMPWIDPLDRQQVQKLANHHTALSTQSQTIRCEAEATRAMHDAVITRLHRISCLPAVSNFIEENTVQPFSAKYAVNGLRLPAVDEWLRKNTVCGIVCRPLGPGTGSHDATEGGVLQKIEVFARHLGREE